MRIYNDQCDYLIEQGYDCTGCCFPGKLLKGGWFPPGIVQHLRKCCTFSKNSSEQSFWT